MKNVDHSYKEALIMHDNLHIHVIMNIIVTPRHSHKYDHNHYAGDEFGNGDDDDNGHGERDQNFVTPSDNQTIGHPSKGQSYGQTSDNQTIWYPWISRFLVHPNGAFA